MKRSAICLLILCAIVGWGASGHAKKSAAPAGDTSGDDQKPAAGGDEGQAAPEGGDQSQAAAPTTDESTDTGGEEGPAGKVEEEISEPKAAKPSAQLSWKDIVVVPRKAFIKSGRLELAPLAGISVNDNLIRHFMFGVDLNYFLTDVLWVGLQGQYFIKQLTDQEQLVGLQYNRTPTLNKYLYGGALNFGYVPVYGKFAWFNRAIMHWEIWASAGIGVTETEVIPRNPANAALAFKNTALTPNAGIGSRFYFWDWLTVNFALRDYVLADKFEHDPDPPIVGGVAQPYANAAAAKADATSALVNNVMFYIGIGLYLPTKFTYKTPQ